MAGKLESATVKALGPREQAKLARILSLLASPFEHERAAAGHLASAFVAKHGLMWSDAAALLRPRPAEEPPEPPAAKHDRRRNGGSGWRGYCRRRRFPLSRTLNLLA